MKQVVELYPFWGEAPTLILEIKVFSLGRYLAESGVCYCRGLDQNPAHSVALQVFLLLRNTFNLQSNQSTPPFLIVYRLKNPDLDAQ